MMLVLKKFQWEPGNCKAVRLPSIKGTLLERIIKSGNNRTQDKSGVMVDSTEPLRGQLQSTSQEPSWRKPANVYIRQSAPQSALRSQKNPPRRALKEIKLLWEDKEGLCSFLLEIFS